MLCLVKLELKEENELREKLHRDQEVEKKRPEVTSVVQPVRVNHVTWGEESCPEHHPTPVPPPPLPPPVSIAVIPIPVVSAGPASFAPPPPLPPATALSPATASRPSPPRKDAHSPPVQPPQHQQRILVASQLKVEPTSPTQPGTPKQQQQQQQQLLQQQPQPALVQPYPGSIITTPQHTLLPQPVPLPVQPSPPARPSLLEETRHSEGKRRPGGAGTREVHNKLEKNRRAHLKECFETLKKNIPNVDEKKTSNLSVLRSALRYIQTLKRKEKEFEHEMERLAREKIATQQRLADLKNELSQWMDVMEVDRVLRQTVQPEDDQASTSTASEGEDNMEEDIEERQGVPATAAAPLPKALLLPPESCKAAAAPPPLLAQHISIQHKPPQALQPSAPASQPAAAPAGGPLQAQAMVAPPTIAPTQAHLAAAPGVQPTVIAHATASASHASVIQAVNHVIQAGSKHIAQIAPSSSNPVQLAPGTQPIGHITVAHLGQHLPALYSQPVAVTQPAVMSHIAHTLTHAQVNGAAPGQQAAVMGKQTAVGAQVVAHHPQLVGQTVLNPVTMVTMPSFPVSTLKLA
uniref:Max-binding protein MNT n=1 Tax=Scleropages formosus TaxID=113540 RepID=A0A8C9UYG4_SCLFO